MIFLLSLLNNFNLKYIPSNYVGYIYDNGFINKNKLHGFHFIKNSQSIIEVPLYNTTIYKQTNVLSKDKFLTRIRYKIEYHINESNSYDICLKFNNISDTFYNLYYSKKKKEIFKFNLDKQFNDICENVVNIIETYKSEEFINNNKNENQIILEINNFLNKKNNFRDNNFNNHFKKVKHKYKYKYSKYIDLKEECKIVNFNSYTILLSVLNLIDEKIKNIISSYNSNELFYIHDIYDNKIAIQISNEISEILNSNKFTISNIYIHKIWSILDIKEYIKDLNK